MNELITTKTKQNPVTNYMSDLKPGDSQDTCRRDLTTIARLLEYDDPYTMPWHKLTDTHVKNIQSMLVDSGRHPRTVNKMMSFVKGVMRAAWDLRLVDDSTLLRIERMKPVKTGKRVDVGRVVPLVDQAKIIAVCELGSSAGGYRDGAILAVMLSTGIRRAEVASMEYEDYDPDTGIIILRDRKNGDDDTVVVRNGGKTALDLWIEKRGNFPGRMFTRVNKSGEIFQDALSRQAIHDMIQRRIAQAGIKPFSPHDIRRTVATREFVKGTPVADIAAMLGHKSLDQTMQYDRSAEQRKIAMAEGIDIPCNR